MSEYTLNDVAIGEKIKIKSITATSSIKRRFMDIGLVENTEVECLGFSPCGDPISFLIRGAVIAIRRDDCKSILIYNNN